MKKGYVDTPEGQIHYRTDGQGPDLLLLHQAPMTSEEYEGFIPLLAPSFRCVAIDLPGHGESYDPPREYEIADYARSVVSAMDALGMKKASIAGHHTGSMVAVEVAASRPDRVDRLALSGLPVWDPEQWKKAQGGPSFRDTPLDVAGEFLKNRWEFYHKMSGSSDPRLWFRQFLIGLRSRNRPYDAHKAVARYPIKARIPLVRQPVLLLSGTGDFFYKDLDSSGRLFANATAGAIEGAGVFVLWEKPDAFARAVQQFLQSASA